MNRFLAVLCAAFLLALATSAEAQYTIQDLGTPGQALGINTSGQVVGHASGSGQGYAFLWDNGVLQNLGAGEATGINDRGQVVGHSFDSDAGVYQAVLWENGGMQVLGTLPGDTNSEAIAINNQGMVIGDSWDANGNEHAFLWDGMVMQDLGALDGDTLVEATGINDKGQVVGNSFDSTGVGHAFLWQSGTMQDLGEAHVTGINNGGQIIGQVGGPGSNGHASLIDGATTIDLGVLPRDPYGHNYAFMYSCAYGINDSGQAVGQSYDLDYDYYPFLWENGVMHYLAVLPGGDNGCAYGINAGGQVVGSADGEAVLWSPVPEPSSILALLCGIGFTAGLKLRNWSKRS